MSSIHEKLIHLNGILTMRPHEECARAYEHSELNLKIEEMLNQDQLDREDDRDLRHPETIRSIVFYLGDGGLSRLIIECVRGFEQGVDYPEEEAQIKIRPSSNFEPDVKKRWEQLDKYWVEELVDDVLLELLFKNRIDYLNHEITEDEYEARMKVRVGEG
jgi:hypothetical protein